MEILDKPHDLVDIISTFPQFAGIDKDVIQWVIDTCEFQSFQPGEQLFAPGDPIDNMVINISGKWAIRLKQKNGGYRDYQAIEERTISGLLPYSRMKVAQGFGIATTVCKILVFHKDHFPELGIRSQELMQALVSQMMNRVREFAQYQNQNEKLMALGKLSAGLAHELNNPAAAMVRSGQELRSKIYNSPEKFKKVIKATLTEDQIDGVNEILFSKIEGSYTCTLSMLDRTDLEDEYTDWLEEKGVSNPEDIAVTFVESGIKMEELEVFETLLGNNEAFLPNVLEWVESTLSIERLIKEIQDSADRISKLVTSVKSYSHMDRGHDKEKADIHEGLRSTLIMMKHKLKDKNIRLEETYTDGVPPVPMYVGEINQVWTNLIDNAIDAMDPGGTLTVITRHNPVLDRVEVSIKDTGAGIPGEILTQIFDPFFTTKEVGQGTGIGLDTTQKILTRHEGTIEVQSEPGNTVFTVCLPIAS